MKKKVLIILPGFAMGGAENMVYELSNHINPENFDVSVLCYCGKQNTSLEKKAEDRIDVHYVNCAGTVTPQKIHTVLRAIDKIRPDVVHAHMGGALYAALWTLKKRKPLVVTIHTTPQKAFSKLVERVLRFRMKFGRCRLVAVSEENKRLADQYFKLKVPCEFVNNGVDLKRFYHKEHELFTFINVRLYEIMRETNGIYGGRFSGAGFKGCCMALIDPGKTDIIREEVERKYLTAFPEMRGKYSFHLCESADGVGQKAEG